MDANAMPRPQASQRGSVSVKGFWLICRELTSVLQESFVFGTRKPASWPY